MASFIHPTASLSAIPRRGADGWNLDAPADGRGFKSVRDLLQFTQARMASGRATTPTLQDALDAWSPHSSDPGIRRDIAQVFQLSEAEMMAKVRAACPAEQPTPAALTRYAHAPLPASQEYALRTTLGPQRRENILVQLFGRQLEHTLPAVRSPRSEDDFAQEWKAVGNDFDAFDFRQNLKNGLEADLNPDLEKHPGAVRAFVNGNLEFIHPELLEPVERPARAALPPYLEEVHAVRVEGEDLSAADVLKNLSWRYRAATGQDRDGAEVWADKGDEASKAARVAVAKELKLSQKQLQSLLSGVDNGSIEAHRLVITRRTRPGVQVALKSAEGPLDAAKILEETVGLEMYGVWNAHQVVGHQWAEDDNWTPEAALASWLHPEPPPKQLANQEWLARSHGYHRADFVRLLKGEYQHFSPSAVEVMENAPAFGLKPDVEAQRRLGGVSDTGILPRLLPEGGLADGGPRPSAQPRVHPGVVRDETGMVHMASNRAVDPDRGVVGHVRPDAAVPAAPARPAPIDARASEEPEAVDEPERVEAPDRAGMGVFEGLEGTFEKVQGGAGSAKSAGKATEAGASTPVRASDREILTPGFRSPAMEALYRRTGNDALKDFVEEALNFRRTNIDRLANGESELFRSWNVIVEGPPGTGKSTGAELAARALYELGILENPELEVAFRDDLVAGFVGQTEIKVKELTDKTRGGALIVDEAPQLINPAENDFGRIAARLLMKAAEDPTRRTNSAMFLLTYPGEPATRLKGIDPGMAERFPKELKLPSFTEQQLEGILRDDIKARGLTADDEAVSRAMQWMRLKMPLKGFRNAGSARNLVDTAVTAMTGRIGPQVAEGTLTAEARSALTPQDFDVPDDTGTGLHPASKEEILEKTYRTEAQRKLSEMVGMDGYSQYLNDMLGTRKMNILLEKAGLPIQKPTLHVRVTGPTGAGKTTGLKLLAEGLYELGYLSKPAVVRKTRADLVGSVIGETEKKVGEVLDQTDGGALLLDEVDQLILEGQGNDYGKVALQVAMDAAEEQRDSRVIFISTYDGPAMDKVLDANDGMRGRFSNELHNKAFNNEQLRGVMRYDAKQRGLNFTPEAENEFMRRLLLLKTLPKFANGRAVRNLLDQVVKNAQPRILEAAAQGNLAKEELAGVLSGVEENDIWADGARAVAASSHSADLVGMEEQMAILNSYRAIIEQARKDGLDPREILTPYFLFAGSPGTGKTTLANELGKILAEQEYLASDRVVKRSLEDLSRDGIPAVQMRKALESALGGTFFLDEFERFADNPAGRDALETLMEFMENHRGELAVVLAGYEEALPKLAAVNPGLGSRFDNLVPFPDLTPENAVTVAGRVAAANMHALSPDAEAALPEAVEMLSQTAGYANARSMRDLVQGAVREALARRANSGAEKKELLPSDLETSFGRLLIKNAALYGDNTGLAARLKSGTDARIHNIFNPSPFMENSEGSVSWTQ